MDLFLFTPLVAPNKEVETEGSELWVLAGTGCFQRETGNHWEISPPVGAKTRQAEKGRLRHQPQAERTFFHDPNSPGI